MRGAFLFLIVKNSNSGGWIKLHRKIKEKGYYKNSSYVHLWVHLLLSANHKPREFMFNGNIVVIKEGQLLTGRKRLSEDTGISESTIERILKLLETEQQIGQQKTTKHRIITILKWREYQIVDSVVDSERTTNGQRADTNKNVKNEENEKKKDYSPEAISLSNFLFNLIRGNDPKAKEPLWDKWREEMDKLIRIDGRDALEIERVIKFSQSNDFWKSNILSAKKLRIKYATLKLQMEKPNGSSGRNYRYDEEKYKRLQHDLATK